MRDILTVTQAAEQWGVKPITVRSWIARGKLPDAIKIGRDWMIPADAQRPEDRRYVEAPIRDRRKK
jgi:excisionase family DNA binding protein